MKKIKTKWVILWLLLAVPALMSYATTNLSLASEIKVVEPLGSTAKEVQKTESGTKDIDVQGEASEETNVKDSETKEIEQKGRAIKEPELSGSGTK